MLTVYPSNRLEVLAKLLEALLSNRNGDSSALTPDQILVESQGMQHWLNMQLASSMGIAMNLQFPMPSRFIWELARGLLGPDQVPAHSSYRREVLAWRIDLLLGSDEFVRSDVADEVTRYWQGTGSAPDRLKRFQLATRLADLFEQYMMFRPDWLDAWELKQSVAALQDCGEAKWQAWIWRALVAEDPNHPVVLQKRAIAAMADNAGKLPERIFVFAINTLAPQTLAFFETLAEHTQVHLFHLNPSVTFWGDQLSDKALSRQWREQQVNNWLNDNELAPRNQLLANLGQQGKDLFNQLQGIESYEISAYVENEPKQQPAPEAETQEAFAGESVLQRLQQDILTLNDPAGTGKHLQDGSVRISSSHNALREIQTLHDYLLHQFQNSENDLKPQDVLVMCPAIEEYAPYIDAVFRRPWEEQAADQSPRLPCSIADRTLLDSEPLVNTFAELLLLPDSRFEVSRILDYLRLPALQNKFGFCNAELDTLEWWLQQACVHWGLNAEHKQSCAGIDDNAGSDMFTWQWGLERLLMGYAQGDAEWIADDQLLLPHVEGQDAVLLGRLMQLLERLQFHARELQTVRTPLGWQHYLQSLMEQMFAPDSEERDAEALIASVVNGLAEHCAQAGYQHKIDLAVVRFYLNHHFSQPDTGNHFMTGQVTFCSMVPMRSIPFKLIAILGLNDGQFPRQTVPISFDLMSRKPRRTGDRSRRGDDRYLFLEALISAREKLYLSYQGRDIRTNSERQPSLILTELMSYLASGYGWRFETEQTSDQGQLQQQALHPFSRHCFSGANASFDAGWLRLAQFNMQTAWQRSDEGAHRNNLIELPPLERESLALELTELVTFFDNPLKQFAQQRLGLYLRDEEEVLSDAEPFAGNHLINYQLNDAFTTSYLQQQPMEAVRQRYLLSGELPESPLAPQLLDEAEGNAGEFVEALRQFGEISSEQISRTVDGFELAAELHWLEDPIGAEVDPESCCPRQIFYRPGKCRAKYEMQLWLTHLLGTLVAAKPVITLGLFLNQGKAERFQFEAELSVADAEACLTALIAAWQQGLCRPLLCHAELGHALFNGQFAFSKRPSAASERRAQVVAAVGQALESRDPQAFELAAGNGDLNSRWNSKVEVDPFDQNRFAADLYFKWFYPAAPMLDGAHLADVASIYFKLYQQLKKVK